MDDDNVLDKYQMQKQAQKFKQMLDEFGNAIQFGDRKITKTLPMKPEWTTAWQELGTLSKQLKELQRRAKSKRSAFWAMVENDTQEYRDMQYDTKSGEILVYEDKDE
jgi:hypothetical protein